MEFKTKSGKKVKLKDVSIDERDILLDSVKYDLNPDGSVGSVKMINTTITKWLRLGLDGKSDDSFLKTLSMEDRTEIFVKMQDFLMLEK